MSQISDLIPRPSSCFAKLTGRRGKGTLKMRTEDVKKNLKSPGEERNQSDRRRRRKKCGKEEETMRKERRRIRSRRGGGRDKMMSRAVSIRDGSGDVGGLGQGVTSVASPLSAQGCRHPSLPLSFFLHSYLSFFVSFFLSFFPLVFNPPAF